jgi:hypothetical protein
VKAQVKSESLVTGEQYQGILDHVFPRLAFLPSESRFRIVLRYLPSSHSECQITIEVSDDGTPHEWIEYISGVSVWSAANQDLREHGSVDFSRMANSIRIFRGTVPISAPHADALLATLLQSMNNTDSGLQRDAALLRESGKAVVVIDGTTYECWLSQGTTEIQWEFMDSEVGDAGFIGRTAVAKWMNAVRKSALKAVHE